MMAVLRQNIAIYVLISIILVENFSFYSALFNGYKPNLYDRVNEKQRKLQEKLDIHRQALLHQPGYVQLHKHFVNVIKKKLDNLKLERMGQSNNSKEGKIGGKSGNLLSLIKAQLLKRFSNQTKGPENIDPRMQEAVARERRTLFVLNLLANRYQGQLDKFRKKYGALTPQQIDRLRGYIDNVGKRREKHIKRLQEAEKKLSSKKNHTSNDVRSRKTSFGKIIADYQSNITKNATKSIESVSEWNARNEKDILVSLNRSINYNKVLLTDHMKATENKFRYGLLNSTLVAKVKSNMNFLIQTRKNITEKYNLDKANISKEHDQSLNVKPDAGSKHTTDKTPVSHHNVSAKSPAMKVESVFIEDSVPETHDEHILEATNQPTKDHGSAFNEKINPKMKSTEIFDMYHILLDELKNLTAATNQFQESKKVVGRKNHKIVLVKFPTANVNDEIKNQLGNNTHNIVLTKNEEINYVGNNDYNKE